jgi:DNA-binding NarL/FixJ family response regulator
LHRYCGVIPGPHRDGAESARVIRVLIVSDLCLYAEGIAEVLGRRKEIEMLGTAGDCRTCLASIRALRPDVVLIDAAIEECMGAVRAIREAAPEVEIVALAVPEMEHEIVSFAEAGVSGYVTRSASLADLVLALQNVTRGELICTPQMTATLFKRVGMLAAERPRREPACHLTRREEEILGLIEEGLSNKQIAQRLIIEVATVKNHLHNIFEKLHVHRRADAVARARSSRHV